MISARNRLFSANTDWTSAAGSSGPPTPGRNGVIARAQTSQVRSAAMPAIKAVITRSRVIGGKSSFGAGIAAERAADMLISWSLRVMTTAEGSRYAGADRA